MAIKRRPMKTRQLSPGMVIDQTVTDKSGKALIERGAILDDFHIEGLLRYGIMEIYIREGQDDADDEKEIIIPASVQKVISSERKADLNHVHIKESVKKRVSEGIQYLYNNASSPEFT